MTDQEIIKALECCANELGCEKCPANEDCDNGMLVKSVFALVTRQQAEIERLRKDGEDIDKFARDICKERMLKGKAIADFEDLQEYIKKQRAEAVREFAEKLDDRFANMEYTATTPRRTVSVDELRSQMNWLLHTVVPDTICNLEKEMEK